MDQEKNSFLTEAPHYLDELYNFSLFMTGSRRNAEKLLSRVIRDAVDFNKYHEPEDIRIWLIRINLNLYNRYYQVPGNNPAESEIDLSLLPQNTDKFLIEEVFSNMNEGDILKLITSLPSEWREVLILKEVLNLHYHMIIELLDIPEGTVIMRLTQARNFIYSQTAAGR